MAPAPPSRSPPAHPPDAKKESPAHHAPGFFYAVLNYRAPRRFISPILSEVIATAIRIAPRHLQSQQFLQQKLRRVSLLGGDKKLTDIIIYAVAGLVAIALILGIRWFAARHAAGVKAEAVEKIEAETGKAPDFLHAFGATAIGLDYPTGKLIVYDRKSGVTTYGPDDIGTWFVGEILQEVLSPQMAHALSSGDAETRVAARRTTTKYVVICDTNNERLCQTGIVGSADEKAVHDALETAYPGKENFEAIGAKSMAETLRGQR